MNVRVLFVLAAVLVAGTTGMTGKTSKKTPDTSKKTVKNKQVLKTVTKKPVLKTVPKKPDEFLCKWKGVSGNKGKIQIAWKGGVRTDVLTWKLPTGTAFRHLRGTSELREIDLAARNCMYWAGNNYGLFGLTLVGMLFKR